MWFKEEIDKIKQYKVKEKEIFQLISLSNLLFENLADLFLKKHNVTLVQFRILEFIYNEKKPVSQIELSRKFNVNRANITGIIDRLEKNNFVKRQGFEKDKRKKIVFLTDKSKKLISTIQPEFNEFIISIFKGNFNKDELKMFEFLHKKLIEILKKTVYS